MGPWMELEGGQLSTCIITIKARIQTSFLKTLFGVVQMVSVGLNTAAEEKKQKSDNGYANMRV